MDGGGGGGENLTLVGLLGEDDDAEGGEVGAFGGVEGDGAGGGAEFPEGADALQGADDSGVLESAATVFAATDFGDGAWFD